jgi:hypothetical protein
MKESTHARCEALIRELQEQNARLVQLAVTSQLLLGVNDRDDVLRAIEEIVVNMIGSEEVAIFEVGNDHDCMVVVRSCGIDEDELRFTQAHRQVRRAWETGEAILGQGGLTAAIPLKVESSVIGVVAIFRLLQQKPALEPLDFEIFDVISRQAAIALYSSAFRMLRPTVRPPRRTA